MVAPGKFQQASVLTIAAEFGYKSARVSAVALCRQ
jgi:hypothetical protein